MRSYKEFQYLAEGKKAAAKAAAKKLKNLKPPKGAGNKVKDAVKGAGNKVKRGLGLGTLATGAGAGYLASKGGDILGGAAKEVGKRLSKIWKGGENDVDGEGAPSDHGGLPKVN